MKVILFFKRLELALQAAAAVLPFLIWVVLWGGQKDALFNGIHPLHAFLTVGAVQLCSMLVHLLPIGFCVWMRVERAVYAGCVGVLFVSGAIAYFVNGRADAIDATAVQSVLLALPIEYLFMLLLASPVLAVWYFWICWVETRSVMALVARKNLLVR